MLAKRDRWVARRFASHAAMGSIKTAATAIGGPDLAVRVTGRVDTPRALTALSVSLNREWAWL